MAEISDLARTFARRYVTDNVPSSGANKPAKADFILFADKVDEKVEDALTLAAAGVLPPKQAVRVRSTANVAIATALENGDTLNGVTLATGDRVFLGSQTAPAENGVYVVVASGAASRATDLDSQAELIGARFYVKEGTVGAGSTWACTNTGTITLGVTALTFVEAENSTAIAAEIDALEDEVENGRDGETTLKGRIDSLQAKRGTNLVPFPRLDGGPYNLAFVNNSAVSNGDAIETTIESFLNRGLNYEVQFPVGNGGLFQYFPADDEKERILGSYICAWFIGYTTDTAPSGAVMRIVGASDGGSRIVTLLSGGGTLGRIEIDTDTWLFYIYGQFPSAGATYLARADDLTEILWGFTSNPSATTFSASEHGFAVRDTPWVVGDIPALVRSPRDKRTEETKPTLTLNGVYPGKGNITVQRGAHTIKREFWHSTTPAVIIDGYPAFNISADYVDDVLFHNPNDDVAPYFVDGGHRGAAHLFISARLTAAAHGKDTTDIGSIWLKGGQQYVLLRRLSASQILMAHRTSESTVPSSGTYTHVSGATHTGDIVATVSANQSWGPQITNRSMRVLVDGREVDSDFGVWQFDRNVAFIETYDVLSYSEVIEWFEASGDSGSADITGDPLFTVSTAYVYDFEGNLTIAGDLTNVSATTITKLYGLQVQAAGETELYIPKTSAVTIDGVGRNYSLIDDEVVPASSFNFNTTNTTAGGLFLDRLYTMTDDHALAVGFVPIQHAEPVARRATYIGSNTGMEISTAGKKYLRIMDDTASPTAAAWDHYKWVGYKNVLVRGANGEIPPHTVRTNEADFFIAERHDFTGAERLQLPPDLVGRPYTSVESLNITLRSTSMNGSIYASWTTAGTYGFLMLRFDR